MRSLVHLYDECSKLLPHQKGEPPSVPRRITQEELDEFFFADAEEVKRALLERLVERLRARCGGSDPETPEAERALPRRKDARGGEER